MYYFEFGDIKLPLSCITGLSYSKAGNIIETSKLSCKCNGINNIQVQVQLTLNNAICSAVNLDFMELARKLVHVRPSDKSPEYIIVAGNILIPQLKFMISSVNYTYQSDRLDNLSAIDMNLTLAASQVVKDEDRNTFLRAGEFDDILPKVFIHCNGESVRCVQDIGIADFRLNATKGYLELCLSDTYMETSKNGWLVQLNNSPNSYVEIEGYGNWYILTANLVDCWLTLELTKFPKEFYYQRIETLLSNNNKEYNLKDLFNSDIIDVKTAATFTYYKFDDKPINVLYNLQDSLGYLIGVRNDKIYLYDPPTDIPYSNNIVTYDYVLDSDTMSFEFTKVILRDGVNEYTIGDDTGETFFVNSLCRTNKDSAERVLKYIRFNQNMITMTIPLEKRINIGSIVNVNTGDKIIPCVCTEYDIDFLSNEMKLELHYVNR